MCLCLQRCRIGDEGVASLVGQHGEDDFGALQSLFFDRNGVTDVGCAALVAALGAGGLPAIEELHNFEHVGDEAGAALDAALRKRHAATDA